jgi:cell division transport system permease protein
MAPRVSLFVRDTFTAMRRNGLIAFAAISTAFIALFLLGFALLIRQEFNRLITQLNADVNVNIYLDKSISDAQTQNILSVLRSMPQVSSVTYRSQDQAYQVFLKEFSNQPNMTQNVSKDALPASFRVDLKDPTQFAQVAVRLQGQPGIATIQDSKDLYDRLLKVTNIFKWGGLGLAVIVMISSMALIGNTVRMAVFDRRNEIGIMRLVGATNWRIRIPFLIEGLIEGLLGAGVAIAGLFIAHRAFIEPLTQQIRFLALIDAHDVVLTTIVLLPIAVLVSVLASMVATSRWLEV